jgi:tetratricopeptide (TPR) repeat protein
MEIDRICGYNGDKVAYYQTVLDYVNGKNTLGAIQVLLKQTPDDVELNYRLASKYTSRWELAEAQPYFSRILELDLQDLHGYNEECRGYIAINILNTLDDDKPLITWLDHSVNQAHLERGYNSLLRFYRRKEMQDRLLAMYEQVVKRMPENAAFMNDFAWYIYQQKLKGRYEQGIAIAQKSLQLQPLAAHIWDTLAWLEFENGQVDRAVEHMKKAVQLAPQQEGYQENLQKLEQSRKKR